MPQLTQVFHGFIYVLALMVWLTAPQAQANELGWMTQEEINQLPLEQQRMVPAWCGGRYYAPQFLYRQTSEDTVLTADRSRMLPNGLAELLGDVEVIEPLRELRADQAAFNQNTGDFFLNGGVTANSPTYSFEAERMSGNQNKDAAQLHNVRFSLFENHARGSARKIEQQQRVFLIDEASYTTCPPHKNTWSISAKHLTLDQDKGWGTASHTVFRLYDKPFFYLPWLTFPIDDRRKTGLLFPTISFRDDDGLDYSQPIYINLHPQYDATVAPRIIQHRGEGIDSEFRYLTQFGEGKLSYGFLASDRRFGNENREIAAWQHSGSINRWYFSADYTRVSDDFYFKDLDTGLDVRSQTSLAQQAEARYRGRQWRFLTRVQSWQTIDPTLAEQNKPYRRLPQLELTGDPELIGPLKMLWLSDFTRFERSVSGNVRNVTGDRLHLAPALTLPLSTTWGFIEPRARVYHTQYALEGVDHTQKKEPNRTLVGTSVDSGMFFERDASFGHLRLQQTLEPRLFYNKVPKKEQSHLPNFDSGELTFGYDSLFRENRLTGYDRIGDEEKLSLGVTSRYLDQDTGREILRLRAAQAYYFDDRHVQRRANAPIEDNKWSPVVGDLTWYFSRHWHLFTEMQWDREERQTTQSRLRLGYSDGDRRIFNLGYRQRREHREEIRQTELAMIWPVHRNWSIIGRWLYDLENKRSIENIAGVEYRDCCVQLRLVTLRDLVDRQGNGELESDSSIMFQIQLTGLGGFGGRIESLLERSISGYGRRYGTDN